MAENIFLKQKVKKLTISNSARNKQQALDRLVLSKGQLITINDVVKICQAKAKRKNKEVEHKNKQKAKKNNLKDGLRFSIARNMIYKYQQQ